MKIYFYGATKEAAEKKCNTFIKTLKKLEPWERVINVTTAGKVVFEAQEVFVIPKAYKFHVVCSYNVMPAPK